jgi:hypothetical protein
VSVKSRLVPGVAVLVLLGGALALRDNSGSGGSGSDREGCQRQVTYSANWGGDTRAFRVEWGPVGEQQKLENVSKPWQELNVTVKCGSIIALHVEFHQPVRDLLCAITANNTVHQPRLTGKNYRCFEQVLVY